MGMEIEELLSTVESVTGRGEVGWVVWWRSWAESRWWPLVILALQSNPPREDWWRCQWAASPRRDARVCWPQQPGWRKAGGSPCAGMAGSADGSRCTQTASRLPLRQWRLQKKQKQFYLEVRVLVNFSRRGGGKTTPFLKCLQLIGHFFIVRQGVFITWGQFRGDESKPEAKPWIWSAGRFGHWPLDSTSQLLCHLCSTVLY